MDRDPRTPIDPVVLELLAQMQILHHQIARLSDRVERLEVARYGTAAARDRTRDRTRSPPTGSQQTTGSSTGRR